MTWRLSEGQNKYKIEAAALDADQGEEVIAWSKATNQKLFGVALPYKIWLSWMLVAAGVPLYRYCNYEAEDGWRAIYEKRCQGTWLQLTLITHGNGLAKKNSRKQAWLLYLDQFWPRCD